MKKLLTVFIAFSLLLGTFSGLCLTAGAENTGESPNLLEMYGFNPNFDDGISPWTFLSGTGEQCDEDSADDDGYCVKVTSRIKEYSVPCLARLIEIVKEQGEGRYYYSFYVKCAKKGATCKFGARVKLCWGGSYSEAAAKRGAVVSSFLYGKEYGVALDSFEVNSNEWTKIEMKFDVKFTKDGKELVQAELYGNQLAADFSNNNKVDLLFDNYSLVKETGGWVTVTPEPSVTIPSQTRVNEVNRSEKTAIGAINYFMWQETAEEWWKHDNEYLRVVDQNSSQEARCLAPDKHHYRLPFWTKMKTNVTAEDTKLIKGTVTAIPEFPEYTEEIWREEMQYAIDAGIDFMAYLWTDKGRKQNGAFMHHINTRGMDGKIKMCAILQRETQDLNTMANAAVEDYWYTVDGMPVVYIYGGKDAVTEGFIITIRRKIALAQYVKNGEVGKPAYIVAMGLENYQTAVGVSSRGLDATTWYAASASAAATDSQKAYWDNNNVLIRRVAFKNVAKKHLENMNKVAKVAKDGYMSVMPLATLGYNTEPRIENPVTWVPGTSTTLPYSGYTADDPTAQEITESVLDVLNFNKENAKYFRANTVLIYCWNEFDEGGWFCPTVKVDEKGNALKNADGSNQVNTEYLDAVKKAISLYREHEAEAAIYDVDGNKIKDVDLSSATEAPKKTQEPKATKTPEADVPQKEDEADNNGWILWVSLGGAVVVAAAAAAIVIVLKKKKATENIADK